MRKYVLVLWLVFPIYVFVLGTTSLSLRARILAAIPFTVVLVILAAATVLRQKYGANGRLAVTCFARLGPKWVALPDEGTAEQWAELGTLHPQGQPVRGWHGSPETVWLECVGADGDAYVVISHIQNGMRFGWLAGLFLSTGGDDQPEHATRFPFRFFLNITQHRWVPLVRADAAWDWAQSADLHGVEAESFAWRCPRCGGVRIDYVREGVLSHIAAKGTGSEHFVRRAYGLIFLFLAPPMYTPTGSG